MYIHSPSLRIAATVIALLCASTQSRAQDRSTYENVGRDPEPAPSILNIFVAPWGHDDWSGRLSDANRQGTDGPFKTFDHARAYVRTADRTGVAQINVIFRGGVYPMSHVVKFDPADSGSAQTEIVYQGFPGEEAVISGGMRVTGWVNRGGNRWQVSLPPETAAFENLYFNGERRLRPRLGNYLGTLDATSTTPEAWLRVFQPVYACDQSDVCSVRAQPDPNGKDSCLDSTGHLQKGTRGYECFDRFYYDSPKGSGGPSPVRADWKNLAPPPGNPCGAKVGEKALAGDIELLIFEQFSTSKLRVKCVDDTNKIIYLYGSTAATDKTPSKPKQVDFSKGSRYIIENVEDALQLPGQWFLDLSEQGGKTLTYLAQNHEDPTRDTVIVPQAKQLVSAYDLHHVTFQGMIFEHDNYVLLPENGHTSKEMEMDIASAVSFQNSTHITWSSTIVRHTAGGGLDFTSCVDSQLSPTWCGGFEADKHNGDNKIVDSAFYDLGVHGIRIGTQYTTADTDDNVPQRFDVEDNVVEGYGRVIPASFGIAQGNGHHNLYTHNDVYDGYHCAISVIESAHDNTTPIILGVAYNTISFNHVHDLLQGIMNDGGSIRIETGTSTTSPPGNRIWNNKIHDTTDASIVDSNGYGGNGIYLDNMTGNIDVRNNLVYRVSGNAVYTPQGPRLNQVPNVIENNILAFARQGMLAVNSPYKDLSPPWATVEVFRFSHNLMYFDRVLNLAPSQTDPSFSADANCTYSAADSPASYPSFESFAANLYWRADGTFDCDPRAFHVQLKKGPTSRDDYPCEEPIANGVTNNLSDFAWFSFAEWQRDANEDGASRVGNPHFVNPSYPHDDFRLREGSPIAGFMPFDADEDGRYAFARWYQPPIIAPTFSVKHYDPTKDF